MGYRDDLRNVEDVLDEQEGPAEPVCQNEGCGHLADQHGARGYGACRAGMVSRTLLDAGLVVGDPECRCKRFRVRKRKAAPPDKARE